MEQKPAARKTSMAQVDLSHKVLYCKAVDLEVSYVKAFLGKFADLPRRGSGDRSRPAGAGATILDPTHTVTFTGARAAAYDSGGSLGRSGCPTPASDCTVNTPENEHLKPVTSAELGN